MASPIELSTEDKLEYNFLPNSSGVVQFRVRAANDAHVALTTGAAESDPMYEVFIGGWNNQKSVIRKNRSKPDVVEVETPNILSGGEFRGFWVRWNNGTISVGKEGESAQFMSWTDSEHVPIAYVGVCTGWGANGSWIIEQPQETAACGTMCWVAASDGSVPPSAFPAGEDNGETMYISRGQFQGGLIPGKLISSHGAAYIAWGGEEHAIKDYEVLCDFNGTWCATTANDIPSNAVAAGQSEEGETLYVGRVNHEGCLTIGKVQPSHSTCYIPYGGQELSFGDYEILVN
ncbi:PREDICTED: C3 and PZP-like alpha-2-macroglobulin domain-containing protein 8 [Nicrophorus vespilloides]|uniref:C3 and PZP-like alpha-2-macroglobulin domain-containing protein 8 n=1 Tax=Nicrophorus vespilloides TaxID=110193 RepID=A0ABM1MHF1_NICVS|nr:PREDICTED: C3 and PZP-like alpha-2-macroglobulin domain-containing protein 8 [Nicrophorus vespilloides]